MRISDWSSDVCSSDLDLIRACLDGALPARGVAAPVAAFLAPSRGYPVEPQPIGQQASAAAQRNREGRHHAFAARLDGDRPEQDPDALATKFQIGRAHV